MVLERLLEERLHTLSNLSADHSCSESARCEMTADPQKALDLGHDIESALLFLKEHDYNHLNVRSHIESLKRENPQAVFIEAPPKFFLNQSRWKSYQTCDRYYGWWNIEMLAPERVKKHFKVGTAVHAAQVVAHEGGGTPEAFAEGLKIAEESIRRETPQSLMKGVEDEEELTENLDTVRRLLPAYRAHYAGRGQLWKPLGMELAFCVEVGEQTGVYLVGRLDNLVTFMNGLYIVDYKTMKKMDMRNFLQFEIDIQLTAYIYGGTKQLSIDALARGAKPVMIRGAIIDGMVKTQVPQFHREIYTRTIDDLREFELEFCMKAWEIAAKHAIVDDDRAKYNYYADRMYQLGRQGGWKITFPKNTQQCFQYGTCSHRDLCVKDNETRRMIFVKRGNDYVDDAAGRTLNEIRSDVESDGGGGPTEGRGPGGEGLDGPAES
jgi:hypothetical protein